jgi:hypothetical protein
VPGVPAAPGALAELDVVEFDVVVVAVLDAGATAVTDGVEVVEIVVVVELAALASAAPPPASAPITANAASALVNLFFIGEPPFVGFRTICLANVRAT